MERITGYADGMNLLICTQVVDRNDSNLGFFHEWIAEFAKHCGKVTVISLRRGEYQLPGNVSVLSLGKEEGSSRFARAVRFLRYIRAQKNEYDAVFVHMNPEYVLLGSFFWRRWHKTVGLWYAHKSVTWKLKMAVKRVRYVFTVSNTSFRVPTPKLCVMGHGIDTELFKPGVHEENAHLRIATAGRISQSKHLVEMLQVLDVLERQGRRFQFNVAGEAITKAEEDYSYVFKNEIAKRPYKGDIRLLGAVPHRELAAFLSQQDVFFNFATTGNMDKAGLEALSAGVPMLTINDAFAPMLEPYGLYLESRMPEEIAAALERFLARPDRAGVMATLRNKIVAEHSLERLIPLIVERLGERS